MPHVMNQLSVLMFVIQSSVVFFSQIIQIFERCKFAFAYKNSAGILFGFFNGAHK